VLKRQADGGGEIRAAADGLGQEDIRALALLQASSARAMALSVSPRPWSLVMRPARRPFARSHAAKRLMDVVFPAPRKPPVMT
jgi:hypothetical protein